MSLVGVTYEQIKLIEKIVQSGFPLERLVSIYKEIEPFPDQVKTIIRIIETGLSLEKITSLYREIQNFEKEKSTENGTVTVKSDRGQTLHEENGQLSIMSLENTSTPDCDPSSSSSICHTSSLNNCKYQTNGTIYSPPATYEASITPPSSINLEHSMEPIEKRETSSNRSYLTHLSQSSHNTSHSSLFQASAYPDDESFELQAFKAKGEEEMLTEMKAFIHKYHITQNIIANWCGLSQGYISRFFKDREQMSETVKDKIYQWYLEFRKNPSKNIGEKLIFSENGDVRPIRRDRFIFKRVHLDILEPAFDENQYPENDVKEELAEKCNVAFERIKSNASFLFLFAFSRFFIFPLIIF